jgi:hypothetical protein
VLPTAQTALVTPRVVSLTPLSSPTLPPSASTLPIF